MKELETALVRAFHKAVCAHHSPRLPTCCVLAVAKAVRRAVLEEAAQIADRMGDERAREAEGTMFEMAEDIAKALRALIVERK